MYKWVKTACLGHNIPNGIYTCTFNMQKKKNEYVLSFEINKIACGRGPI